MKVKEAETYIRTKVEKKKVNQGQKKENDNDDGKMRKGKSGKERMEETNEGGGKSTAKVKVK